MKKLLLSAFAGAMALSMSADAWINAPVSAPKAPRALQATMAQAPSRAEDEGYTLKFYGDIATWYVFNNTSAAVNYTEYIYISPEEASQLAGNVLDQISYSVYLGSGMKSGSVFVTEDIDGTPVVEQSVRFVDTANTEPYYKLVDLTNPYTIKEGVGFYFGFTIKSIKYSANQYVIPVDDGPACDHCGAVRETDNTGKILLEANVGKDLGDFNLAIFAHTSGEKGLENVFNVGEPSFGDFTMPILCKSYGSDCIYLPIKNVGGNELTSVEYSYSVNGGETVSASAEIFVAGETEAVVELPFSTAIPVGQGNVTVTVEKVNDIVVNKTSTCSFFSIGDAEGYARKYVVEEGTGTWCGWCPRGIYAFEYMEKNYADDFVGIAVHASDAMSTNSYRTILNYFDGYPECVVNRDKLYLMDPNWRYLEMVYDIWQVQRSPVKVAITDVKLSEDGTSLDITAETTCAIDLDDATFSVAFALIEDGVPGVQTNNYSGQSQYASEVGDWVNYSSSQPWMYNHVARDIFDCTGNAGSVPASVKGGEAYPYTRSVSLSHVSDITKTHIVALVLETKTGIIMNATVSEYEEDGFTGIADKAIDAATVLVRGDKGAIAITGNYNNAQVYTISGQNVGRTTGLAAGIYVVVVDGKAHKVAVK